MALKAPPHEPVLLSFLPVHSEECDKSLRSGRDEGKDNRSTLAFSLRVKIFLKLLASPRWWVREIIADRQSATESQINVTAKNYPSKQLLSKSLLGVATADAL